MQPRTTAVPLLLAGAILASACGGGSDAVERNDDETTEVESTEPADTEVATPATDAPVETTPPTDPPVGDDPEEDTPTADDDDAGDAEPAGDDTPVTTIEREPGDGTSPEQAAALSGAPIEWTQRDASWSFDMAGLTQVSARNEDDGDCLVLFGTATAVDIGDRSWSSPIITPDIDLQVGDELLSPNFGNTCDETATLASNHADESNPRLISGASVSFAYHYPLGEFTIADVDAVVWGGDNEELVQQYYLPTIIDAPPAAVVQPVDYSAYPSTPLAGATTRVENNDVYDLEFQGVVTVEATSFAEQLGDGECKVVLGAATAVSSFSGFATFGGTAIGIFANGRLLDTALGLECDTAALDAAGYQPMNGVALTAGTSIDFYQAVFIPDELADTEQLVVSDAFFDNAPQFFEPSPLDAVPAPLAVPDASVIPASSGSSSDGPFTFQEDDDETTFTITIDGVFDAGQNDDANATCFYIFGTMTADREENVEARVGLITAGQYHDDASFDCDQSAVEDAGWENVGFADFEADTPVPFHELILVPNADAGGEQFLVIGNPSASEPHIVLDPVYLDAVPTR